MLFETRKTDVGSSDMVSDKYQEPNVKRGLRSRVTGL